MNQREISELLRDLIQLDVDAVHAYDQSMRALDGTVVQGTLAEFRLDHQRHVLELSQALLARGEAPPPFSSDVKGFVLEGFTALRALAGVEGALLAMRGNEQLTNTTYARALAKPLPAELLSLVRRNYADEQRHLAYIESALDGRIWEGEEART
ncbi:MAG TPA: ferritin-like domain-containing protein [Anaeromyxobacteraceae bacterium]|jgi:rubrerythrin|nr:ferritin-like domain-containing protein [Anaeromyxobacteraceae bacterium]